MFTSSFLQMASQGYYWSSPPRLTRIVWSIASNLPRQLEIFRILSLPAFSALVPLDPALPFKYLSTKYLGGGLSAGERASCFIHHYRFLEARLPGRLFREPHQGDITIFEMREGDGAYAVTLGFPPQHANLEGELCLQLLVDRVPVYALQFSVVPGWAVRSKEKDAVFILRLQGGKGCYRQISSATKALHEVAPPALLVAALEGIAHAWGIREMAGICATSQYSWSEQSSSLFKKAYDDFFLELGSTRTTGSFFSSPLPRAEKPIELITNGHRSRTLKKRAFKLAIADAVCRWMAAHAPGVAGPPAAPVRMPGIAASAQERVAA